MIRRWFIPVLAALAMAATCCPSAGAAEMKPHETRYYIITSDHDDATVKEADARLTAMAEEYHRRTKDFAGTIRQRLPFYLFSSLDDYKAAGGLGAGIYAGNRLMAHLPKGGTSDVWHVVQHEGFHQFAAIVIRGRLPVWVNEGLAEYFGEGIWTGDGFVTGVVPADRLRRVKQLIATDRVKPFLVMLMISNAEWMRELDMNNYDQAWSMVHFLVHAEDGKYRKGFEAFIRDISKGARWPEAFEKQFGRNVEEFQKRYAEWWLGLGNNTTADLYTRAVCETMTSFLARSLASGQKFDGAEAYLAAARAGTLRIAEEDWLPPTLLAENARKAAGLRTWSLEMKPGAPPKLVLTETAGRRFVGTCQKVRKTWKVQVDVVTDDKKPAEPVKPRTFELPL